MNRWEQHVTGNHDSSPPRPDFLDLMTAGLLVATDGPRWEETVHQVLKQPLTRAFLWGGFGPGPRIQELIELLAGTIVVTGSCLSPLVGKPGIVRAGIELVVNGLNSGTIHLERSYVTPADNRWPAGSFSTWPPREQAWFHGAILYALEPGAAFLLGCLSEGLGRWPVPPGAALVIEPEWNPMVRAAAATYNATRSRLLADIRKQNEG